MSSACAASGAAKHKIATTKNRRMSFFDFVISGLNPIAIFEGYFPDPAIRLTIRNAAARARKLLGPEPAPRPRSRLADSLLFVADVAFAATDARRAVRAA